MFPSKWAQKNEDMILKMQKKGHEISNHGYQHINYDTLSYDENFNEIKKATIELAELENTILRINKAVEKVKNRSNALKDIKIPQDIEKIKVKY